MGSSNKLMMMNMSSSASRNSDLIRPKSSNSSSSSSSSSSTSTRQNNNNNNSNSGSGLFHMTLDSLFPNNHHRQPPTATATATATDTDTTFLDAQITLSDAAAINPTSTLTPQQTVLTSSNGGQKSVDDVWKEIVAGRSCKQEVVDEMMTLEDFLAKAGAVEMDQEEEEDVKIPPPPLPTERLSGGIFSYDNPHPPEHKPKPNLNPNVDGFGVGIGADEMGMGMRGKRRAMLEPLDKAAQQRQRRMIKNRESAARSRERKQAYQAELESLALKLEEENETLLKAKTEQTRKRYKQLMDNIIPVTEKPRPTRYVLRKVRSMDWKMINS